MVSFTEREGGGVREQESERGDDNRMSCFGKKNPFLLIMEVETSPDITGMVT